MATLGLKMVPAVFGLGPGNWKMVLEDLGLGAADVDFVRFWVVLGMAALILGATDVDLGTLWQF